MKILHVNEFLAQKGGVEAYLRSLMPLLDEVGVEQYVAFGEGEADQVANAFQVNAIRSTERRYFQQSQESMSKLIHQIKPDLVHVHNVKNIGVLQAIVQYGRTVFTTHDFRLVCPASMFYYKRSQEMCTRVAGPGCFTTTLTKHCLTPRPGPALYFYNRVKWFKRNQHRGIHLIAPSQGAQKRFIAAGWKEKYIQVLPYFCPIKPLTNPRPAPEKTTITYMGRMTPSKGYTHFVKALGMLPDHVQGIMVGSFSAESEALVSRLATETKCKDRLELKGWASREEVMNILDRTSVFVFPSVWPETLGIVGLEALSRGVPVVASDIGGVREWLVHGSNGFLANPKSPEQIKEGVLKLIEDKDELLSFGQRGIDLIHEKFLPEQHVNKLMTLYEKVAAC